MFFSYRYAYRHTLGFHSQAAGRDSPSGDGTAGYQALKWLLLHRGAGGHAAVAWWLKSPE